MTVTWVIGGHGLLGSALLRELDRNDNRLFVPGERFRWNDQAKLGGQFAKAVAEFADLVGKHNSWQLFWAAGVGTMGSSPAELETETRALSTLLGLIEAESMKPYPASQLEIVDYVAPRYPMRAFNRNLEGWVDVEFFVTTDGTTRDVVVTDASHESFFRDQAVAAVERWQFEPRIFLGQPIEQRAYTRIRFNFQ